MIISPRWDNYFLQMALVSAKMSKDPSTKVGAIIAGPENETLCSGFNGFPRNVNDLEERYNDRELKYKLIVHAELNAILTAAKLGVKLKGCRLYFAAVNAETIELVWGGPCINCSISIIQAGITEIVTYSAPILDRWAKDMLLAKQILAEAGIIQRIIKP